MMMSSIFSPMFVFSFSKRLITMKRFFVGTINREGPKLICRRTLGSSRPAPLAALSKIGCILKSETDLLMPSPGAGG
jgi:hypothetical protein